MDDAVFRCPDLLEEDIAVLRRIERDLPILADIVRADMLIYCRLAEDRAVVVAQARPHSVPPIYSQSLSGDMIVASDNSPIFDALEGGSSTRETQHVLAEGAPVVQDTLPINGKDGKSIGALVVERTMIEKERHRHRPGRFRKALERLEEMVLRGELEGLEALSPFREEDGILLVDQGRRIRYSSEIATNMFRRLGYMETLEKKLLSSLNTSDDALVDKVLRDKRCAEEEARERDRVWVRKAIPIFAQSTTMPLLRRVFRVPTAPDQEVRGVLIMIHDATTARRQEKEARIRAAMTQEIHHRVKNNLQTIASILRLQSRRSDSHEVRQVLLDSVSRILSVAVVHEFLSEHESRVINIKDVSRRILDQFRQGVVREEGGIRFHLHGSNIYLPTQQATACALIVNELLQNALEHGFSSLDGGEISVELRDDADRVTLKISDSGRGLPDGFDLERDSHLGLTIVQTLVKDDLRGGFELRDGQGAQAIVTFPKMPLGGEQKWRELE